MTFQSERPIKAIRKARPCEHCGATIPVGAPALSLANFWDGQFNSATVHPDCRAFWHAVYYDFAGDDGMDWRLGEVFSDAITGWEAQQELNAWRGQFPHVVCRLEFRWRDWLEDDAEEMA